MKIDQKGEQPPFSKQVQKGTKIIGDGKRAWGGSEGLPGPTADRPGDFASGERSRLPLPRPRTEARQRTAPSHQTGEPLSVSASWKPLGRHPVQRSRGTDVGPREWGLGRQQTADGGSNPVQLLCASSLIPWVRDIQGASHQGSRMQRCPAWGKGVWRCPHRSGSHIPEDGDRLPGRGPQDLPHGGRAGALPFFPTGGQPRAALALAGACWCLRGWASCRSPGRPGTGWKRSPVLWPGGGGGTPGPRSAGLKCQTGVSLESPGSVGAIRGLMALGQSLTAQ